MVEATLEQKRSMYRGKEWMWSEQFKGIAWEPGVISCLHCGTWRKNVQLHTHDEVLGIMQSHKQNCKRNEPREN